MRRIQAKNHKFGTYEIDNHYLFSKTKDLFQKMVFIRWLIFIKT